METEFDLTVEEGPDSWRLLLLVHCEWFVWKCTVRIGEMLASILGALIAQRDDLSHA